MGRTIDRGIARLVAQKRIFTGATSLLAGVGCIVVGVTHGGRPPGMLFLAMAIFFGGGAWSLRDGLRLKRALAAPIAPLPDALAAAPAEPPDAPP